MRKTVSAMMLTLLILSMLMLAFDIQPLRAEAITTGELARSSSSSYDRQAAYDYGQRYWDKVCSDRYFWDSPSTYISLPIGTDITSMTGYDCAHFVSCCIGSESNEQGGGLNVPSRVPPTYGEPGAARLGDWLISSGNGVEKTSITELSRGDVINYDWDGDSHWDHIALCLGNGKVAAHTACVWETDWQLGGAVNYRFIHIKGTFNDYYTKILDPGDNLVHGFVYYEGYLWASTRTSPCRVLKIDPETLDYERIILDTGLNNGEALISADGYIWVALDTSPCKIVRVDPETLAWEVAVTINELSRGTSLEYAFGYLWAGGAYGKIARINLIDLAYEPYSYPSAGSFSYFASLISGDGYIWATDVHYSYWQGRYYASTVIRFNPTNPSDYTSVYISGGPLMDDVAFVDGHFYTGSETSPSCAYKISDSLTYSSAEISDTLCYAIFANNNHIWGAYVGSPGKIVELDLNLNILATYQLPVGFNDANEIAFDAAGNMYVTCWESPAKIVKFSPIRSPICAIELQQDGEEINEIDARRFFDVYVGDSTDDQGIRQVRFSSDEDQDGVPEGDWTRWYDWDSSLSGWDASTKIMKWSFETGGRKEVWVEMNDTTGNLGKAHADIFAHPGYVIIVAGQGWYGIDHAANNAYRALRSLGFNDDHIFYLNSERDNVLAEYDIDEDGDNDVDKPAFFSYFEDTIVEVKEKVGDNPTPLVLYLVGHGEFKHFDFDPGCSNEEEATLSSTQLNNMLKDFSADQMLIVIGSCYSGSFITTDHVEGSSISAINRIVITATHNDQKRYLGGFGWFRDSDQFWADLSKGFSVKEAFIRRTLRGARLSLWLDDNGDAKGNPPNDLGEDGALAAITYVGVPNCEPLEHWEHWLLVWKRSPGELRVYDSENRVTGLVNGEIKEEIPNSVYDEENEITAIFSPSDDYSYYVVGTEQESYGLEIAFIRDSETTFNATDIPSLSGAIQRYTIDWNALSQGEEGVIVRVDSDGDGSFEYSLTSDTELTYDEYLTDIHLAIDLNGDRIVDILDIAIAATAFNSRPEDDNWKAIADLNGDWNVNIVDLAAIAIGFGKTY